jgi:hypothetical protein
MELREELWGGSKAAGEPVELRSTYVLNPRLLKSPGELAMMDVWVGRGVLVGLGRRGE